MTIEKAMKIHMKLRMTHELVNYVKKDFKIPELKLVSSDDHAIRLAER